MPIYCVAHFTRFVDVSSKIRLLAGSWAPCIWAFLDSLRQTLNDECFISRCLELATNGAGAVSPNPMVGAVVVRNGKILAEGFHQKFGGPHAEIEALRKLNFRAHGATLYVNLEPCCHFGKTPPCVDRVIASGIKNVVISHLDPNPRVSGRSVKKLQKYGVKVKVGVLKGNALFLNRFFDIWVRENRPYVIAKMAISLDGKIAQKPPLPFGERAGVRGRATSWITGPIARRRVHEIRSQVDAILVGAGTVLADDPRLTVRGVKVARQPLRVILDSRGRVPGSAKIFKTGGPVVIVGKKGRRVSVSQLLRKLAKKGISSVLVEGGSEVFRSFQRSGLIDEMILHVAPKLLGDGALALSPGGDKKREWPSLRLKSVTPLGADTEFHFL